MHIPQRTVTASQKLSEAFAQIGVVVPVSVIETAARRAGITLTDSPAHIARSVATHLASHATLSEKATL